MPNEPLQTPATPTPGTEAVQTPNPTPPPPETTPAPLEQPAALTDAKPAAAEPPPPAKESATPEIDPKAFKLPEGVQADEAVLGEFAGVAKELGVNQEGAQRLVDLYAKQAKAEAVKPYEQWHAMQKQWQDEIKADPTIGGDKLEPALQRVAKVLDTYGDPEVRKALSFTGAGNNPAIIRTLVKMADALSEGGPIAGAPPTGKPKTAAEAMYPHLKAG
jgi:hypothetical protein